MKFKIVSSTKSFAELEFQALGYKPISELPPDDCNRWIQENVLELLEVFGKQGHSGFSAPYAIHYFTQLASFKPLSPLTGEDWEWTQVVDNYNNGSPLWQNKRCYGVFKDLERAWYIDGKVFREPNGVTYTNKNSHVDVTFPYTPKTEYVDVPFTASNVIKDINPYSKRASYDLERNLNPDKKYQHIECLAHGNSKPTELEYNGTKGEIVKLTNGYSLFINGEAVCEPGSFKIKMFNSITLATREFKRQTKQI